MRVVHGTLLGDALNGAKVAALLASEDGQYVAANDEACRLTGYDRPTLTSLRSGQLAADVESQRIFENITHRKQWRGVKTLRRRDGDVVQCDYWAVETRVTQLPYVLLMLWQPSAAAA